MENRIKEQQLGLPADRTSTAWMRSNQLRLYVSSFAYIPMQTLRRLGLQGTELAQAQCDTIRLKLFKIGAQIEVTVRKVWISFSRSNERKTSLIHLCSISCLLLIRIRQLNPQTSHSQNNCPPHGFAANAASKPPPRAKCKLMRLASWALRSLMT
jgi:hypothetical protein